MENNIVFKVKVYVSPSFESVYSFARSFITVPLFPSRVSPEKIRAVMSLSVCDTASTGLIAYGEPITPSRIVPQEVVFQPKILRSKA